MPRIGVRRDSASRAKHGTGICSKFMVASSSLGSGVNAPDAWAAPVNSLLVRAELRCLCRMIRTALIGEHDLVARLAQPRLVALQAGNDRADIRDVAAAEPKHVRPTCILLLHRSLRGGRARRRLQRPPAQRQSTELNSGTFLSPFEIMLFLSRTRMDAHCFVSDAGMRI